MKLEERNAWYFGAPPARRNVSSQLAGFDISRSGVSKIEARLSYVDDKTLLYLPKCPKSVIH